MKRSRGSPSAGGKSKAIEQNLALAKSSPRVGAAMPRCTRLVPGQLTTGRGWSAGTPGRCVSQTCEYARDHDRTLQRSCRLADARFHAFFDGLSAGRVGANCIKQTFTALLAQDGVFADANRDGANQYLWIDRLEARRAVIRLPMSLIWPICP